MLPTKFIDIDFETRSELDITQVGARVYAEHPSTEILMISFSINQKDVFNWNPFFGEKNNKQILEQAIGHVKSMDGKIAIRAFHSEFEYWVWNLVGTRQFGWSEMPIEYFYDVMVQACIAGFPAGLDNCAIAMGLDEQKDKKGKQLIGMFSKPSRKKGESFKNPLSYPEEFKEFIYYCDQDVRTQIAVAKACPPMTERHHAIFILTERMNVRGLPIDKSMAEGALALVDIYKQKAAKQIKKITNGAIESASQNIALQKWVNEQGCNIPNMQAPTIEKFLASKKTPDIVKKVLQIRSSVSKSSTAKYSAALQYLTFENTVHGFIKAFIARTGRWGGRGLQIQNFSKPHKDFPYWCDYDVLAQAITDRDLRFIEVLYMDVMETLKAATRAMIHAPKGYKFISADYAQIEARIVMWMANSKTGLRDFSGEGKIYESMASDIFSKPINQIEKPSFERDVGKETVLGCGFGMGHKKFLFRCVEQRNLQLDQAIAQKAVKEYRSRYSEVPSAWKQCEIAAIKAIQYPGKIFSACKGKLVFQLVDIYLTLRLPSRRALYYPYPVIRLEDNGFGKEVEVIYYKNWDHKNPAGKKWDYEKTWGGILFQHAVQGTAMDIMANGMLNAEKNNYPALFTVHDESLAMVKKSFGSVKEYEEILCQLEPWAKGLPIIAEGWEGTRYKK